MKTKRSHKRQWGGDLRVAGLKGAMALAAVKRPPTIRVFSWEEVDAPQHPAED